MLNLSILTPHSNKLVYFPLMSKPKPTLQLERRLATKHTYCAIAGVDEAGRGALAGAVVAAAVILPLNNDISHTLANVTDSKLMTAKQRDKAFDLICEHALCWGIGSSSAKLIDEIGILPATERAMKEAVDVLSTPADCLLIDGRDRFRWSLPHQKIIKGDQKSLSIAAASILAKVYRDRLMKMLDKTYPAYGFAQHKGYGTKKHRTAIEQLGATPHHRYTFAPINGVRPSTQ